MVLVPVGRMAGTRRPGGTLSPPASRERLAPGSPEARMKGQEHLENPKHTWNLRLYRIW